MSVRAQVSEPTDLVDELQRLVGERAALRRIAALAAGDAPESEVLKSIAAEVAGLLGVDHVRIWRFEGDTAAAVASTGIFNSAMPVGWREPLHENSLAGRVRRTGRSQRVDDYAEVDVRFSRRALEIGVGCAAATPIVVDGRLWGVAIAAWSGDERPAADAELRLERLAELLETAIASAESRDQLTAVRARLLAHADEVRRGVLRDLHDGAQQPLVHTIITLKLARQALHGDDGQVESLLDEALDHAQRAHTELRELVHGILPAALTHGGLRSGVEALARRLDLPVELDLTDQRLPAELETAAYFIVAEALTNVVKHAHATRTAVTASVRDGDLRIEVHDDGIGGADPNGRGLVGIGDRITALDGRLMIESPPGVGTLVAATLPLWR